MVPQLLSDDMLSEGQKAASRRALYPTMSLEESAAMPVSPLSIAERALDRLFDLNPALKLLVLGGDHSVAWPVVSVLAAGGGRAWGWCSPTPTPT